MPLCEPLAPSDLECSFLTLLCVLSYSLTASFAFCLALRSSVLASSSSSFREAFSSLNREAGGLSNGLACAVLSGSLHRYASLFSP